MTTGSPVRTAAARTFVWSLLYCPTKYCGTRVIVWWSGVCRNSRARRNSFHELMKTSTRIAAVIGLLSGSSTYQKVRPVFAPSTRAASSNSLGIPSTKLRASNVVNGICRAATGRITAHNVLYAPTRVTVANSGASSTTPGRVRQASSIQKKNSLPLMCSFEKPNAAVIVQMSTMAITAAAMIALLMKKPGSSCSDSTVR